MSRDVGVYREANVAHGIGVKKAGQTVDVRCWTAGQSIGGYAIWDQIAFNGGTAYVHDKYVSMPGGSTPAANRIPKCGGGGGGGGGGTPPAPRPERCVKQKWVHYLALIPGGPSGPAKNKWEPLYRVSWTARFCPRGNGDYTAEGTPDSSRASSTAAPSRPAAWTAPRRSGEARSSRFSSAASSRPGSRSTRSSATRCSGARGASRARA